MPSSSDPTPDTPATAVVPPVIDPARWEDFEGFRETTLAYFTDPTANATLRGLGALLYTLVLEYWHHWPAEPRGSFFHLCHAGIADLRHLQGFFAHLDRQRTESELSFMEERASVLCGALADDLRAIGDILESEIHPARGPAETAAPPSLGDLFATYQALPWPESRQCARDWLISRWILGFGAGRGNARLLRQIRAAAEKAESFGLYHVIGLELLAYLKERGGKDRLVSLGVETLAEFLLKAPGIPPETAAHYAEILL
jgi:hypothetical protein